MRFLWVLFLLVLVSALTNPPGLTEAVYFNSAPDMSRTLNEPPDDGNSPSDPTSVEPRELGPVPSTALELQNQIIHYINQFEGQVTVSVVAADGSRVVSSNSDFPMPLASVVKLHIMLAYLVMVENQDRDLRADEDDLLQSIISYSDNDAAQYLWNLLGDTEAMQNYFETLGLKDADAGLLGTWGDTRDSAEDMALALIRLAKGTLLPEPHSAYALRLLNNVVDGQRWGVSAGLDTASSSRRVLLKNGWYYADEGWRVNSVGLVRSDEGLPLYGIAVLTDFQDSYEQAVKLIETISAQINAFMLASQAPPLVIQSPPRGLTSSLPTSELQLN